jgi:hypothetical protein
MTRAPWMALSIHHSFHHHVRHTHRYRGSGILRRAFLQGSHTRRSSPTVLLSRRPLPVYLLLRTLMAHSPPAPTEFSRFSGRSLTLSTRKRLRHDGQLKGWQWHFRHTIVHRFQPPSDQADAGQAASQAASRCPQSLRDIFDMLR